jgi:hypothetical protein
MFYALHNAPLVWLCFDSVFHVAVQIRSYIGCSYIKLLQYSKSKFAGRKIRISPTVDRLFPAITMGPVISSFEAILAMTRRNLSNTTSKIALYWN